MNIQAELQKKKTEFERLTRDIERMDQGPARLAVKRRRAGLSGEIVNLRQQLIEQGLAEYDASGTIPENVPRETFGQVEPETLPEDGGDVE
jgi:hypothetical protein